MEKEKFKIEKTEQAQKKDPERFHRDAYCLLWKETTEDYDQTYIALEQLIQKQEKGVDFKTDRYPKTGETEPPPF